MACYSGISIGIGAFFFCFTFKSDPISVESSQIANDLQVGLVLGCSVGSTTNTVLNKLILLKPAESNGSAVLL